MALASRQSNCRWDNDLTSCSKAKQRKILANSVRFAQRCRELLAIEYGKDPKILDLMSPRLQCEIVLASRLKSPAKLVTMRAASPKPANRSRRRRILEFLKELV
jgi:hypothetical protein